MKKIPLNQIEIKSLDLKDECHNKKIKTLTSITKYGQVRPLIVEQLGPEYYVLISGQTVLECLRELEYEEGFVVIVNNLNDIQKLDLVNLLTESVREVNTLKLAHHVSEIPMDDNQIAQELSMKPKQITVIKDLLKLDFYYKQNKDNSQKSIFDELA